MVSLLDDVQVAYPLILGRMFDEGKLAKVNFKYICGYSFLFCLTETHMPQPQCAPEMDIRIFIIVDLGCLS